MRPRDAGLAVGAAAAWGVCFVLLGSLTSAGPPLALAAVRALLGGAVLGIAALWRGGPSRLVAPGASWAMLGLLALLNGGVAVGAMFLASRQADAAAATVVGNTQPLLLAAAGLLFLRERPGCRAALAIGLGTLGVLVVALGSRGGGTTVDGLALALLSSAAPAIGTLLMRRLVGRVDLLAVTAWQFLGGGVGLLAAATVFEPPVALRLDPVAMASLLFLGVVGTGLAYMAWFGLLERVPLTRLGSALYLVPVSGVAADVLAGGRVTATAMAGLVVMLAGVALAAAPAEEWSGRHGAPTNRASGVGMSSSAAPSRASDPRESSVAP